MVTEDILKMAKKMLCWWERINMTVEMVNLKQTGQKEQTHERVQNPSDKKSTPPPRFEGMRPGESFIQFSRRIDKEKRSLLQMVH